ncbi:MAG: hypothetical protein KY475_12865, partial [Planctomycetes bacterium]|nr:hypothetical protein [Planctomycetota bacterium]
MKILESPFAVLLSFAIALTGVCLMAHLTNLRLEALHYARAVNGIRKHFYRRASLPVREEFAMRALPRTTSQPRYWEPRRFGWIIGAFIVLDELYLIAGLWPLASVYGPSSWVIARWVPYLAGSSYSSRTLILISSCVAFALVHWGIYAWLVRYYDTSYLRTRIIGLDIDGVIGDQRRTFCAYLRREGGARLSADSITKIPVHECMSLLT